jgi:hypothetical protein
MPRIVKEGAELKEAILMTDTGSISMYAEADTTEIKPGWRPKDHVNPYEKMLENKITLSRKEVSKVYEAGYDACIEAEEKV